MTFGSCRSLTRWAVVMPLSVVTVKPPFGLPEPSNQPGLGRFWSKSVAACAPPPTIKPTTAAAAKTCRFIGYVSRKIAHADARIRHKAALRVHNSGDNQTNLLRVG